MRGGGWPTLHASSATTGGGDACPTPCRGRRNGSGTTSEPGGRRRLAAASEGNGHAPEPLAKQPPPPPAHKHLEPPSVRCAAPADRTEHDAMASGNQQQPDRDAAEWPSRHPSEQAAGPMVARTTVEDGAGPGCDAARAGRATSCFAGLFLILPRWGEADIPRDWLVLLPPSALHCPAGSGSRSGRGRQFLAPCSFQPSVIYARQGRRAGLFQ